jgi:Phospholipase_D-nuclease N-terminal
MLRVLPAFIAVALLVAALIDAAQTPESQVRNLQKWVWILIILVVPFAGPVSWFIAGRPRNTGPVTATNRQGPTRPRFEQPHFGRAPDDDPEFLAGLKSLDTEHEELLKKWEADLKRREEELRKNDDPEPDQP